MNERALTTVIVPQVGEGAAELVLSRWIKQAGDHVRQGEELFEVDTEKATVVVEAFVSGTLVEILVPEGAIVSPLQAVATLHEDPVG